MHPFRWGSFQHILIQILTAVLLGPSLPKGYLLTTSLQKAVQSWRVRGEQAQLLCTRSRVVMQGFRSCFSCFSCTRTPFFAQTTHRVFTWTTDSASPIYQFSAGTHSHATQANRPAFNFSLGYRPSLAIETLVKAISEVEGVFWQPTPEVDTSGLNDGSLHLIVRYGTLPQPQVRRTQTRAVVAIKVACVRAEIKIPQPVPVILYSRTLDRELVLNFELGEGKSGRVGEGESGRVGEGEKSSFSPRTSSLLTSSPLTSSLNIHPLNPLNPVHCCVAELPSDFLLLTFQSKQKASQFPISAPANCILFFEPPLVSSRGILAHLQSDKGKFQYPSTHLKNSRFDSRILLTPLCF